MTQRRYSQRQRHSAMIVAAEALIGAILVMLVFRLDMFGRFSLTSPNVQADRLDAALVRLGVATGVILLIGWHHRIRRNKVIVQLRRGRDRRLKDRYASDPRWNPATWSPQRATERVRRAS